MGALALSTSDIGVVYCVMCVWYFPAVTNAASLWCLVTVDVTLQCQWEVDDVIAHSSTSRVLLTSRGFSVSTGQEIASNRNSF